MEGRRKPVLWLCVFVRLFLNKQLILKRFQIILTNLSGTFMGYLLFLSNINLTTYVA